jgi:hypothetical protein
MDYTNVSAADILGAVQRYGASSGASALRRENEAAQESIRSGLYITWIPRALEEIVDPCSRQRYESHAQCCRVSMEDSCLCGHKLNDHKAVSLKSKYIIPPKCNKSNCRCLRYNYAPSRPEETGQWWLLRRKDFDIKSWQQVVILYTHTCMIILFSIVYQLIF